MTSLNNTLSHERLKQVLHYDPDTGIFTRKARIQGAKLGAVAGGVGNDGYCRIRIGCIKYMAHRLVWLYVHGDFPVADIDHINGSRADNRIANLRKATDAENSQNRIANRNSTSKYLGVYWNKLAKKWKAQITVNRKQHYLGYFVTEEEAHAAYRKAKAQIHTFNPVPRHTER